MCIYFLCPQDREGKRVSGDVAWSREEGRMEGWEEEARMEVWEEGNKTVIVNSWLLLRLFLTKSASFPMILETKGGKDIRGSIWKMATEICVDLMKRYVNKVMKEGHAIMCSVLHPFQVFLLFHSHSWSGFNSDK